LSGTSLNGDEGTARSCSEIGACEHDITDFTSVGDASCGYCLSTLESHGSEQPDVICQLTAADVTADELLRVVSNSHVTNSSQESSCAGDTQNPAASSPTHDICNMTPGFHIGQVGFKARLRVNVETLAELELWQKDFAERSKTTMRYANVSICTGKKTLYKVCYVLIISIHVFIINYLVCMCRCTLN